MTSSPLPASDAPAAALPASTAVADITAAIASHPLLAGCSTLERAKLLSACQPCQFSAGATLIEAGAQAEHYYWIVQGEAELQCPQPQPLGPGEGLGQEAFADGPATHTRYLASVRARTEVQALRIERAALRELVAGQPALRSRALLALAARLGALAPLPPPATPATGAKAAAATLPTKTVLGWCATLVLPLLAWALAEHAGLPPHSAIYLGLFTMTALLWLFSLVDEFIPPLIAVVAMLFIELVPARVALHGFYSRTFILLLGVYALAALMASSGLAYRFMLWLLLRLPDRPFWHRTALTAFGFLLSVIMPSANARMSLMLPLHQEMDASLRARAHSPEATALMLATFTGATVFAPLLLTAKSSNLAALSMLPPQVRQEFQGAAWLVGAAVVALGLLLVHLWAMRQRWLPSTPVALPMERLGAQLALLGPLRAAEWVAALAFVVFLLGSFLPQWHQSQAAWLAGLMLAALLVLGLLNKQAFQGKIDWPMIFFLLSLDGLTEAINYLGLDKLMLASLGNSLQWMDGSLLWFTLLALVVTVALRLVLPLTAGMVMAVTLLLPLGMELGIHPWLVVFLASLFSDIWFLPHQNSTYQQVLSMGLRQRCDVALFMRYNWRLNGARVVLAFASIPYWQWIGLHA